MSMPPPGSQPPSPPPGWQGGPAPAPGYPSGYAAYPQPAPTKTNGLSVASMVLGIVGILLCFLWLPSILAVVFGGIALNQIKNDPRQGGKGMAIAGLTLGIIVVAVFTLVLVAGGFDYQFDLD